eukprot:490045_1
MQKVEFLNGDVVQLHGLSMDKLNGKIGSIESFDKQSNRYIVSVNNNRMKIKPTNLNTFISCKPTKIENKGMGLTATRNIKPGEVIFTENMAMGFKKNEPFKLESIVAKFNKLSSEKQSQYLTLSHHTDEKQSQDIIVQQIYLNNRVENERCFADDCFAEGLLLHYSLLNHSCIPNAFSFFEQNESGLKNNSAWKQIVITLKNINKNEEILINYLGGLFPYEERQNRLFRTWKFKCLCTVCIQNKQFQKQKDAIYARYNNMENGLKNDNQMSVNNKIKICINMLKMLHGKEMINEPRIILSKIHLYLAQFYIQLKEWDNAVININKSIENDIMYYNKYMDWTDTNFVIKSMSNKYLKQYGNSKFKQWSHVKGLKIPFLNDKKKTHNHKKKRRR